MKGTRLEQIEQIYLAVIDQPPDRRRALLDNSCDEDIDLRREVESLLRYDGLSSNFIDSPPGLLAAEMFEQEAEKPSLIGKKIGHYRIERLLGAGGMGEVYLAEDLRLHRRVALKLLPHNIVDDAERLMRFEREAQAASALNHPNIFTVYEFGEDNGVHFITSEFVDGVTLRHKLFAGPLEILEALDIAIQASSALSAAHEAGITHRDIKSENIMVRRDGYIKVLDFGLAKLNNSELPSTNSGSEDSTRALLRTEPGVVMGTDAYMSPEQARGRAIDARTDIWSLGVVIYEMVAGHRPFLGDTRADIIVSVLSSEPRPLSSYRRDTPAELEWIVSKALTKDVEGRYQTSKELRADLIKTKKHIELHESMSQSAGRDLRTDGAEQEERVHSTIETGLRTSPDSAGQTNGESSDASRSRAYWSSRSFVFQQAQTHKISTSIFALVLAALVSSALYFFILAPKANAQIDSIAVLPFENLSGNADLTYVSDGLSESLIDRLAQLPQLKVISRSSSFKFRGSDIDLRKVASQLGARAVVTGSVAKVGDDLVIRVDMVDAIEDRHLTGGQYRRKADDIISIPNDIARMAVDPLRLKLTDAQRTNLDEKGTENSEAYRYYLNGLVELNASEVVRNTALESLEHAVKLDPNFAAAYAEIAWTCWNLAMATDDPNELMPKAKAAAEKALTLDSDLAKAHAVRAMVYESEFNWRDAEREYMRSIELGPNLDFARNNYAFFLSVMDRQDEALAQLEEQRVRDPLNQRMFLLQKAIVLVQARQFEEAIQVYGQAQAVDPDKAVPDFALGYAYAGKGSYDEAVEFYKKAIADLGGEDKYSQPLIYLAATYAKMPEKRNEARAILRRIENMNEYVSPALLAAIYSALDDNDKAMELLERAYIKRDLLLRYIKVAYEYDGLRSDPRFIDLERRMGFAR